MTTHRITNITLALIGTLALGASHLLDGDASDEWASSAELKELQATEAHTARRNAAAAALCAAERGPNSEARWTPEGHLVCTTRRGVQVAQGGVL